MEPCKDCGKEPREIGKVRCVRCSIRIWQRTVKKTARDKLRALEYLGGKCVRCSFEDLSILDVFEFHHLENKDKELNKMFGRYGWERIKIELEKCVPLCVMCHRKEHYFIRKEEEQERLNLLPKKSTEWPEEDLELLRSLDGYSMKQIREVLPHYSSIKLQNQAQLLGLTIVSHKNRPWLKEEVEVLRGYAKNNYSLVTIHKCMGDRSLTSIRNKLIDLGLFSRRVKKEDSLFIDFSNLTFHTAYLLGVIWGRGGLTVEGHAAYISISGDNWRDKLLSVFPLRFTTDRVWINNPESVSQLTELGLLHKTDQHQYHYPNIDSNYHPAFIRGFFDAKASVVRSRAANVIFCGMPNVSLRIDEYFNNYYPHTPVGLTNNKSKNKGRGKIVEVVEMTYNLKLSKYFLEFIDIALEPNITSEKFSDTLYRVSQSKVAIWTKTEEDLLKEVYITHNRDQLMSLFPDKSWGAIYGQKNKMGLRKPNKQWNRWTSKDIKFLKENNSQLYIEEFVSYFRGRHSRNAIQKKMLELGVSVKDNIKEWDTDMLNKIKEMKRDGYRVVDMVESLNMEITEVKQAIEHLKETLSWEERVEYDLLSLRERKMEVGRMPIVLTI